MIEKLDQYFNDKKIRILMKFMISVAMFFIVIQAFFMNGIKPYCSEKEYLYQNDFMAEQVIPVSANQLEQRFIAKGNKITNLSIFINSADSQLIDLTILNDKGKVIKTKRIDIADYSIGYWNKVDFECDVDREGKYVLRLNSENGLNSFIIDRGDHPEIFLTCDITQEKTQGCLVMGIQQSYVYMTLANLLELNFSLMIYLALTSALCFAVFNFEKLMKEWSSKYYPKGVWYAMYFATTLVLVFNPIDAIRVEMDSFKRVIGAGLIENVDVTKRISNFNFWYIYFIIAFIIFYILVNHYKQQKIRSEQLKVVAFLDQLIVLSNVNLFLRCITYFADRNNKQTEFYYSTAMLVIIVSICIIYIILNLDEKINSISFLKLEIIAFCLGYTIAIISQKEWGEGRLLFGIQSTFMLLVPICVFFTSGLSKKVDNSILTLSVNIVALLPFLTSFYIEFINILNQHYVFVYDLRNCYIMFIVVVFVILLVTLAVVYKMEIKISKWKIWTYSWLVLGLASLQQQIPLEDIYNIYGTDIFEAANSSILISDFLKYKDIPIIQHYGGHMMSGVWEGLIYAILNNDFQGAIFSPYSGYIIPILAVLFFLLLRKYLGDEIALLATLFFPFMDNWVNYGLGMAVCLAMWAYLKNNTYLRAATIWLAFINTAIYRLDLGFSIGMACIATLIVYVVVYKNWKAAKQLTITLIAWGIIGIFLWFGLCWIKNINPINRLMEFLMISLSNENWSYDNIGNTGNMLFAWCYILIPFCVAGGLCITIVSKKFREKLSLELWVLLLILGFAYFTNFSRGLVRHSLVETAITTVLWDAYIFIALFLSFYTRRKGLFLPLFSFFIISNVALITPTNYILSTIGDRSSEQLGEFTHKWTVDRLTYEDSPQTETYWMEIARNKEKINRVKWSESLKATVYPYKLVIDALLEEDETFVDFSNKTFMYSAIGRRNPVYVSQSPLQLSGEFTQKMFIDEMHDIPIVLMPINNEHSAYMLDGIANSYRYYKVAEYIYQNYVPLCRYDSEFAAWCLPERYDDLREKMLPLIESTEYVEKLYDANDIFFNCKKAIDNLTGERFIMFTGTDPKVDGIQNIFDLSRYIDENVKISVVYETDIEGDMQLFYTTVKEEIFTEERSLTKRISGEGIAEFIIPVTKHTRLRLDIPEKSSVKIKSLVVSTPISIMSYGYDDPIKTIDEDGNNWNAYDNGLHSYRLSYLPSIWAENDIATLNRVKCELERKDTYFLFDRLAVYPIKQGNYLLLNATFNGFDMGKNYCSDDENIEVVIKLGEYENCKFTEKYQYVIKVKEGEGQYLIRISNDYHWYYDDINAVKIVSSSQLNDVSLKILEGD